MAKFKDFYDTSHGIIYNINAVNPIGSEWLNASTGVDVKALDNYLLLHIGNREVVNALEDHDNFALAVMGDILKAYNFKLDGLWKTTQLDDQYDPLDNKNRIYSRTESVINAYGDVDITNDIGARKQTNVIANRSNSESLGSRSDSTSESIGSRTDSHTSSGSTTPFDASTDYSKATDKISNGDTIGAQSNSGSVTIGAQSNSSTLGGGTDTYSNDSAQDKSKTKRGNDNTTITISETEHGNIGVTTSGELLEDFRRSHNLVFFDYVQEIMLHEFAKSFLWE